MKDGKGDISSELKITKFVFNKLIHDLNNKFSVIMGNVDMLEEDLNENGKSDRKINEIKNAANNLEILLRLILLFKYELSQIDVSNLSNDDLNNLWFDFKDKHTQ